MDQGTTRTPSRGAVGLARAALAGLGGGLLLGGALLLALVVRTRLAGVDCAGLSVNECELAAQGASELARYQALFGAGLVLLAVALLVLSRTRRSALGARELHDR